MSVSGHVARIALRASGAAGAALVLVCLALLASPFIMIGLALGLAQRAGLPKRGEAAPLGTISVPVPSMPAIPPAEAAPAAALIDGAPLSPITAWQPSPEECFCAELLAVRANELESIFLFGRSALGGLQIGLVPAEGVEGLETAVEISR